MQPSTISFWSVLISSIVAGLTLCTLILEIWYKYRTEKNRVKEINFTFKLNHYSDFITFCKTTTDLHDPNTIKEFLKLFSQIELVGSDDVYKACDDLMHSIRTTRESGNPFVFSEPSVQLVYQNCIRLMRDDLTSETAKFQIFRFCSKQKLSKTQRLQSL